jgi:uncharacterized protein (TIGR02466 family)
MAKDEKQKVTVHNAFPTNVGVIDWEVTPDGTPIDEFVQDMEVQLYRMRAKDPDGIYRSNLAGTWHSKDTVLRETKRGPELERMFHTVFQEMSKLNHAQPGEYGWQLQAWCMMYSDRGYATPHTHPNCHFSGVFYVNAGAETEELTMATGVRVWPGMFEAIDPRTVNMSAPGLNLQPGFRLPPKTGRMICFPSWLPHMVHPVIGDDMRIAVACNGAVKKFTPAKEDK